ncbi:MAG TPA: hypothetical protein DIT64_02700 [Verrucomicrobiales bacterium]|nr:hypothetical protein [Verrucomicrobiales bacterium]HCN78675.1 hypothetical protein [Verrucomicrobiales bacterium]HRJ08955.1 hypothetical protein [Prosthecobacter sp.]HRK15507.1 hypothetical protein [Prosthecobacter sp.]
MKHMILLLALFAGHAQTSSAEEKKVSAGGLDFVLPSAAWDSVPTSSPMRAATLKISVEGAEQPLEAVFYYFGAGQGGDVEANVQRWFGQFEGKPETKREDIEAGGKKVTLVTATGTYMDGAMFGPKTPKPDSMLLGSIIPGPDAPVFIKLTGPKAAVAKVADEFRALSVSPFK